MIKKITISFLASVFFIANSNAQEADHCFKYIKGRGNKSDYQSSQVQCATKEFISDVEQPKVVKEEIKKQPKQEQQAQETKSEILQNKDQKIADIAGKQPEQQNKIQSQNSQKLENIVERKITEKSKTSEKIKTEGNYFGIGVIGAMQNFYDKYSEDRAPNGGRDRPRTYDTGLGFALEYKYALNFNDFFIAPTLFFEKYYISTYERKKTTPIVYSRNDIDNRYGLAINAGYDINNVFSPYLLFGYSLIDYTTQNAIKIDEVQSALYHGTDGGLIYGSGIKINYNKNISFNIEGNIQSFSFKTDTSVPNNIIAYNSKYVGRLSTAKIGIFYNF